MRLNTSTPTLFVVSSLFCFGSSLPFFSRRSPVLQPLVRRATYSVVPVDGGPAATDAGQPAATIVQTIVQTQAPVTVVETDQVTLPAVTNIIISTKIVEGPKTTKTILVTVSQSPVATTTATKYSIIDVSSPPVTVVIPAPVVSSTSSTSKLASTSAPAPSSSSAASISSATSTSLTSSVSTLITSPQSSSSETSLLTSTTSSVSIPDPIPASSTPTSTPTSSNALSTSISSLASVSSTLSTSYTGATTSSFSAITAISTPAYDNGQWHTYYPSWSNSTGTRTASGSAPTLSPISLDSNSGRSPIAGRGFFQTLKQLFS